MSDTVLADDTAARPFGALRRRLLDAAAAFADGPGALTGILTGIVDDVDRALRQELEVFPVCHHSPASALAMARRLRDKRPEVVYLELCEDLRPLLPELRNCRLPVALQAFSTEIEGFPPEAGPLSVIAPITEASAEYQAIAYALDTPGVELVLVDHPVDHVFQQIFREGPAGGRRPRSDGEGAAGPDAASPEESAALHGDAVGVRIGDLRPGFAELEEHLLRHGKVRHWSEWWDQYVEQPLAGADYDTYRQVMVMIGSLFRRLRPADPARLARDEERERHMWTRMREHLAATGADPARCLYVCGAFHAASRVEQFGLAADAPPYEIPPRTGTRWRYGLIPSSHSAIEAQFGLAAGSVSIAEATWAKAVARGGVAPFRLKGQQGTTRKRRTPASRRPDPAGSATTSEDRLSGFLATPPKPDALDEAELIGWCVDIVRLARRNGYLAGTADAIAVYETSVLLAGLRGRARPTPYDFQDAAVTCIEKDTVPGRRDVRRLCEILLGGDRVGQVGYDALPPLARDVYDRLAPLGLDLQKRTIQRALLDLGARPELGPCSDVLWMLRYLLPDDAVRLIMGERRLGERSIQESWDVAIGRHQRSIIELGYEGVTLEQVVEKRLRKAAWAPDATAATALAAVEDAINHLGGGRVTEELGMRAVALLAAERTVDDAPEVLRRIRELLAYHRSRGALPAWCEAFVTTGYAQYCTLLPSAFADEDTGVRQVAAMLGFLLTMESLALSLGCDRAQLELAVRQSHPHEPAKTALLWAAQYRLGMISRKELRSRCAELLDNPLVVPAFPRYLSGLVQALEPVPELVPIVVETLSKAFGRLPDPVLLPWLPRLITTLREQAGELVPLLVREAERTFPGSLAALDAWVPPWAAPPAPAVPAPAASPAIGPAAQLLAAHPQACHAAAVLLGCDGDRREGGAAAELVSRHPATADAVAALFTPIPAR
ncbi:DUF5682 family protein [Thermostaphylospora chromogena]|uniref:Uncharacterized protein n=1 Tax=Thermostaphylospora chromogena TaxID=35622 RepID=A0A1H1HRL7_9ACTN|nr:DUF5682 family protein [Thermostaphylospora chromogena]SDR28121.1 hypothetical protein SAMN04489764_4746 [Thermostaphylospora chromogena]